MWNNNWNAGGTGGVSDWGQPSHNLTDDEQDRVMHYFHTLGITDARDLEIYTGINEAQVRAFLADQGLAAHSYQSQGAPPASHSTPIPSPAPQSPYFNPGSPYHDPGAPPASHWTPASTPAPQSPYFNPASPYRDPGAPPAWHSTPTPSPAPQSPYFNPASPYQDPGAPRWTSPSPAPSAGYESHYDPRASQPPFSPAHTPAPSSYPPAPSRNASSSASMSSRYAPYGPASGQFSRLRGSMGPPPVPAANQSSGSGGSMLPPPVPAYAQGPASQGGQDGDTVHSDGGTEYTLKNGLKMRDGQLAGISRNGRSVLLPGDSHGFPVPPTPGSRGTTETQDGMRRLVDGVEQLKAGSLGIGKHDKYLTRYKTYHLKDTDLLPRDNSFAASLGGKASAAKMTPAMRSQRSKAGWDKLTPAQRSDRANSTFLKASAANRLERDPIPSSLHVDVIRMHNDGYASNDIARWITDVLDRTVTAHEVDILIARLRDQQNQYQS